MENQDKVLSLLKLHKLLFETIEFHRLGIKNENTPKFNIQSNVMQSSGQEELYKVELIMKCVKEDEYNFNIKLAGYFSFLDNSKLSEKDKTTLISRNTVSILMPYMRSQISLLTAQPEVDCIVLPPFNISAMIDETNGEKSNH